MSFLDTIERAKAFLGRNGRVSLSALKREFELDDAALEALADELVEIQQVANREGRALVWIGSTAQEPPAAKAERPTDEPRLEGPEAERRQLTVMFCDLVGSTDLAGRLDAEELREVVRAYQEAASSAIERYEGHVAQYLGDGLLVYFGWPRAHEDAAERAVRAGREILTALPALSDRLQGERGLRLRVRVGIHTGPVVVGEMGGGGRTETLALGSTPNVAARLEAVAEPDSLVISEATLRLVPGVFVTRDLGTPALKGVAEPIRAFAVLQATGVRSRVEAGPGRLTPLVGRQKEMAELEDAWEQALEGRGQAVVVSGEAGLGKSRLCYELRARLAREPHTYLECHCSRYTAGTAFHPVVELVDQALAFRASDGPSERLRKLAAGLALSGFGEEEAALLAEWLGLPEEAGYARIALNADVKRQQTLETLTAWNLKLAELQPVIVLVEDLHWCDPSSLELFGRLVAQGAKARVLLLGTARPEFESPWTARQNARHLTLQRLTSRQAREVIASVSRERSLPDAVMAQLLARADGVPLYAEELARSIADAAGDSTPSIPATLQDSLLARLDRISSAKKVAQRASVLGREFSYRLLAATAGFEAATLREALAQLTEAKLLFVRGEPPEATYTFKHALVQEAAYESLLKRTRRELHGRIAKVLAADAGAEPELLAHHQEAAGRIHEAVVAYQRAGEKARARSAYQEEIRHLRKAIGLLGTQPEGTERDGQELALLRSLGTSLMVVRGYAHPEVEAVKERQRVLCEAAGDARELGLALAGLANFSHNSGHVERARTLAAQVLEIATRLDDAELRYHGHFDLGVAEQYRGDPGSSLLHLEASLDAYEPKRRKLAVYGFMAADRDVPALSYSAWALWLLGWPDTALDRACEAVDLARQIRHPLSLTLALVFETVLRCFLRDPAGQRERAVEAVALSGTHGFPFWLGVARICDAAGRVATGEREAAEELGAGLAQSGGTGNRGAAPGLLAIVANAFLDAGEPAKALGVIESALALGDQTGQHFHDAELLRLRGEVVLAGGGVPAEAEAAFRQGLEIACRQKAKSLELRAATSLGRLLCRQGKGREASELLAPVHGWFVEGFDTRDLEDAKALLEELG